MKDSTKRPWREREESFGAYLKKRYFSETPLMEVRSFDRFFMIPDWLAAQPEVSFGAMAVYGRLLLSAFESGIAWMEVDSLAADFAVTDRTIRSLLDELEGHGLISRKRRRHRSSVIGILPHPWSGGRVNLPVSGSRQRIENGRNLPLRKNPERKESSVEKLRERKESSVEPHLSPYYMNRRAEEVIEQPPSEHTHSSQNTPNTQDHRDVLRASQPQEEELSSLRGNAFCSSTTTPNANSVEEPTDLTALKNLVEDEPQGAINISHASMNDSYSESGTADVDDFNAIVRMVKSKQVKTPTSAKQRQAIADAFDSAIAKDPMDADELESRYRAFAEWCETKTGKIPVERFFSRRLTSWDARETPAISRQTDPARPMAGNGPTATEAAENRSTANLRAIWNECCPSAPTDESIESVEGWKRWTKDTGFVSRFREIATAAEVARAGGMGWLTIGWIVGKKDGNALWNWQRLLSGDFAPRNKKADSVTTAPQVQDDAIQQMRERGIQREKELMVKLRQEWEQKNREREEDALPPKPKPAKLAELEAKYETN